MPQHYWSYLVRCTGVIAVVVSLASSCAAETKSRSPQPQAPWQELNQYPGLLPELGKVFERWQHEIKFPPPRTQSRLLPLLPRTSIVYVALSNYGDAANQALRIFREQLDDSPVLRDWWQHGEMASTAVKIEEYFQQFHEVSQYLGDEIVIAAATDAHEPSVFMVAEVRNPGLKSFLQRTLKVRSGNAGVRIFDAQELAAAKDVGSEHEPAILVRPDFVVAASDTRTLRNVNAQIERKGADFLATPFAQRVAREYESGVTVLGAFDLQAILSQVPPAQRSETFRKTGFADMQYLVWGHTSGSGQQASQAELSFTGPRRGVASWLGPPVHPGSLDFVSRSAMMVSALGLVNPAQMFDDIKELATSSNPMASQQLAQMEAALNVRLKEDLLRYLTGEITLEVSNITRERPEWKAVLGTDDPRRLQESLAILQAAMHLQVQRFDDGGVSYYSFTVPASKTPTTVTYAFVDKYLVVGPTQDTVAEAVRLHATGESLGQSSKFWASLPPGHDSKVSALFYQDPLAMTVARMRLLSPGIAANVERSRKDDVTPVVVCMYGEESAIREASTSAAADFAGVLVGAAIAIPNLLRARIAANEATAISIIRTIDTAQAAYGAMYPRKGFARDLAALGPDPKGKEVGSAEHAGLLQADVVNETCAGGLWCTKFGYRFNLTARCGQQVCKEFVVLGTPVNSNTGQRSFCSTSDQVVRFKAAAPLNTPITARECRSWPPL